MTDESPAGAPRREQATLRILHISDIHVGRWFVPAHFAGVERFAEASAAAGALDAIIVSGDLSQRARSAEFAEARRLLERLERFAPLLVVPGNHDSAWWRAPFGVGNRALVHEEWRRVIDRPLEPTLRLPGVVIVGLNSAPGLMPWTLTSNPRDLRVKGGLTAAQLDGAARRLDDSAATDLRVLVLHHNILQGLLSRRWGLARPATTLDAIAAMDVDVVCTGHDHEERAEQVVRPTGTMLVSAANTLSRRVRGHRVSSFNVIERSAATVSVAIWHFDSASNAFALHRSASAPRRRATT